MKKEIVVLDTNVLLDNPETLLRDDISIVLPYVVLAELDKLKRDPSVSYPAKHSIRIIKDLYKQEKIQIVDIPDEASTNDEKIVDTAKRHGAMLWSGDAGANVIAMSQGVKTFTDDAVEYDKDYIGYSYHTVDKNFYYKTLNMTNELMIPEVEEFCDIRVGINEYAIVKPDDDSLNELIFRRKENSYVLVPNSKKLFRGLGNGNRALDFDFLHPEQACAFDAVFNSDTPLAVIQGKIGSGKTLLSTVAALARTAGSQKNRLYDKIMVTRPNRPISRDYELGFMPGTLEEKMKQWLVGFTSNLEFLYEKTLEEIENNAADEVFKTYFSPISIESVQGASFPNKILIVDESQLLDYNTQKQVMSRLATGSKLVLLMDPNQTYGANRGREGFKKLLPFCKNNNMISYVNLQNIQRSALTSMVDEIFRES